MSCYKCGFNYKSIDENIGCKQTRYFKDGMFYEAVKVGDPGDFCEGEDSKARCHDCGAPMGTYHHGNCDAERCPICGGQLWTCECFEHEIEEILEAAIKEIYNKSKEKPVSTAEIEEIFEKYGCQI